ncbi:IS630 family transposase [Acidovorax sp. SUPP3334]|uniref:IS630 family transposase n=1 Tax=Acidovorax sp. SUPP3334 TaxID=2920881 RepID=UPI0024E06CD8|nr:IS630 family transposase [Acidovorax sp. SUPP3334]
MKATDMRSLSREARHERRVQVIRLRNAGRTYDEIAAQTGLSRTGVFDIVKRHEATGARALQGAPGGRKLGEGRRLDAAQEAAVRKLITDKTPDQLKMSYALWTRAAVGELIEQRFGVRLPVRTMGLYLARWGFRPQKPMKKAYEQSPAAVKKWLEEEYPVIAACAKVEGADIHWGDEMPSYSPQLNPNEMANADLKQAVTKLAPARTKLQLVKATARHLRSVQRKPERIKSYFEHEPVRYAA